MMQARDHVVGRDSRRHSECQMRSNATSRQRIFIAGSAYEPRGFFTTLYLLSPEQSF